MEKEINCPCGGTTGFYKKTIIKDGIEKRVVIRCWCNEIEHMKSIAQKFPSDVGYDPEYPQFDISKNVITLLPRDLPKLKAWVISNKDRFSSFDYLPAYSVVLKYFDETQNPDEDLYCSLLVLEVGIGEIYNKRLGEIMQAFLERRIVKQLPVVLVLRKTPSELEKLYGPTFVSFLKGFPQESTFSQSKPASGGYFTK